VPQNPIHSLGNECKKGLSSLSNSFLTLEQFYLGSAPREIRNSDGDQVSNHIVMKQDGHPVCGLIVRGRLDDI